MSRVREEDEAPRRAAPRDASAASASADRELVAERERLRITLSSIGDAVISTDAQGRIVFLNGVAERLTGWSQAEAEGRPLAEVFRIVNEITREPAESPVLRALREGTVVGLANHTILIARDGTEWPIDDSAAPMRDESGTPVGAVLVFRDVSERRRAHADQARLAAIVESSDDAIVSKDLDGKILSWNRGAERLFGYTGAEAVGRSITMLIPPERREEERYIIGRILRGERVEPFETVRVAKDGRHIDISLTVSPVRDGGGRVIAASKIARDITEQKRAGRALAESRARLDYAVRLSGVGFWYCDLPFDELIWDDRVREHFWVGPGARVTIETFYERIHPEDRERTRQAIEASIRDDAPYNVDYRTVDPITGAVKWLRALGGTARGADGTPLRFDGVTVDITDRKEDELRLARMLARERERARLMRRVADASLSIHASGTVEAVLKTATEEAGAILGARWAASGLAEEGGGARAVHVVGDAPRVGEGPAAEVCRRNRSMRRPRAGGGGRARDLGWLAAPLVGRGGENLGLIELGDKAGGDFTEEDEVVLTQLAHIASVAVENARLNEELRDQDRRKDEFLALLAHELRNPLAPLRNGLELVRLAAGDPSVIAQARGMMERQLGHMVRLIDDLMDISRINRDRMELRRGRILLEEVVANAVEAARPLIELAGHELTVSLPSEPVALDADLTRLAQVVSNLLTNSAKYTEPGGRIRLSAERRGPEVVISVQDTGIGIPAEALPRLFDMFSQVDRGIERAAGGLGIGLALVKAFTEMHGGSVEARSDGPGRGSTFIVRLPVAVDSPAPAGRGAEDRARTGNGHRILVVDDSRDSAHSMARVLKLLGSEVRTAHDGVEALDVAAEFRPEVILMDVGMPRLNGYEATRRIRQQPWGRDVVIIALTGWGQEGDRIQSREAGCDRHMVKPVDIADLERYLAELRPGGGPRPAPGGARTGPPPATTG